MAIFQKPRPGPLVFCPNCGARAEPHCTVAGCGLWECAACDLRGGKKPRNWWPRTNPNSDQPA